MLYRIYRKISNVISSGGENLNLKSSIKLIKSKQAAEEIIVMHNKEEEKAKLFRDSLLNNIIEVREGIQWREEGRFNKNNYNREAARKYVEEYAEKPNIQKFPYYNNADCANFVSQALTMGGIMPAGKDWESFESWFCNTNNSIELTKVALTWRAARYFRMHWGNEAGTGRNRANEFITTIASEAMENFEILYNFLEIGDVIQYGDLKNRDYPYHTQIVHNKGFNISTNRNDLLVAQHSVDAKNISLYNYISLFKDNRKIYLYKI